MRTELSGHAHIALGKLADGEWHWVSNRTVGRYVSRPTADALERRGWAEMALGSLRSVDRVRITEAGRKALAELEAGA